MAKRKRSLGQGSTQHVDSGFSPAGSKLKYSSYADIADSEDEFYINRDKIMLEGDPDSKRRKQLEEDIVEPSDEEVLAYSDAESGIEGFEPGSQHDGYGTDQDVSASVGSAKEDGLQDYDEINEWGASKSDFYNADVIQTEQDALEEEEEARRLQQKRLKALKDADFGFNETEWMHKSNEDDEEAEDETITEVLPELRISADMSSKERSNLLTTRYPEFEPLASQLVGLQSLRENLLLRAQTVQEQQKHLDGLQEANAAPVQVTKFRALSTYLGALAMYFAMLTSTATDDKIENLPLAPHILQNHNIMDSLLRARENWKIVKGFEDVEIITEIPDIRPKNSISSAPAIEVGVVDDRGNDKKSVMSQMSPHKASISIVKAALQARRAERLRRTEKSLAGLANITTTVSPRQRPIGAASTSLTAEQHSDVDSDIGDESALAPHEAAEKARRKKSLRFYTSQIAQRANKRAGAGRAAGGDDDVPYRERLRDRQERLMREAENRGKKGEGGLDRTELHRSGDGTDEEASETNRQLEQRAGSEDAEVNELEARVFAKKVAKHARASAYAEAKETGGRVIWHEEPGIGLDGRREVGYAIEKNKGLMPRRKKEVKNPRVKKRKKFEEKTKKLQSMKAVYKGGEGRGGYAGELTGIKKGLVRSVKF